MPKANLAAISSTFVVCFLFWLLITWSLDTQELIAGAIVSLAASCFGARFFIHSKAFYFLNPARFLALIAYIPLFLIELTKANIDVAARVFNGNINPGIVKVPVDLKSEYAQAMLANSITLTPGTITMDIVEEDGQAYYYIHWLDTKTEDPIQAGQMIKGSLERGIRRIWP